ncbi:hypothetical protein [Nonomuraea africana]|uniref:hypothetical protein n=1 Tax=Nonomuraea africana TaxID=46171 RepID=UPI00178BD419
MMTRLQLGAIRAPVDGADEIPAREPREIAHDRLREHTLHTTCVGLRVLLWIDV